MYHIAVILAAIENELILMKQVDILISTGLEEAILHWSGKFWEQEHP